VKNLSIILQSVLLIAVIILYYLHFSKSSTSAAPTTNTVSNADTLDTSIDLDTVINGKKPSIVFVNIDSLLEGYSYFQEAQKQLEARASRSERELENKMKNLEAEYTEAQRKAQSGEMTQGQMEKAEQELMKKQQELYKFREDATKRLAEEEQAMTKKIYTDLRDFLKQHQKEGNYDFVLGYTPGGGILFANDSLDITNKVINALNKNYSNKKK
jgi:outer membrane protein